MQGRSKMIGRFNIVTTLLLLLLLVANSLGFASSGFNPFRFDGDRRFSECLKHDSINTNTYGERALHCRCTCRDMQTQLLLCFLSAQCSVLSTHGRLRIRPGELIRFPSDPRLTTDNLPPSASLPRTTVACSRLKRMKQSPLLCMSLI